MLLRFIYIYICFVTFYTYCMAVCPSCHYCNGCVSPGWPDLLRRALCVLLRGGGPQAQEGGAGRPHPPRQRQRQPPGSEVLPQPVDNHLMRHFVISSQIVCQYVHVQQIVLQFTRCIIQNASSSATFLWFQKLYLIYKMLSINSMEVPYFTKHIRNVLNFQCLINQYIYYRVFI